MHRTSSTNCVVLLERKLTDVPALRAVLTSSGSVSLDGTALTSEAWREVTLILGAASAATQRASVPVSALVRERRRLAGALGFHQSTFIADDQVSQFLRRSVDDARTLARMALGDATEKVPNRVLADAPRVIRRPRDFQVADVSKLNALPHGANFSVPGAGKTTVTYMVHAEARRRGRVNRMLVVAPLSAFSAWEEEAAEVLDPAPTVSRFAGGAVPNADVILINYQRVSGAMEVLRAWMSRGDVHLVVDEAHRVKRGTRGEWGRTLAELAPLAARRDILTGTPAPNHPRDLIALLDLLWPDGSATRGLAAASRPSAPSQSALRQVNEQIKPLFVRTTKTQLNLPPMVIKQHPVPMGELQAEVYSALRRRYSGMRELGARDASRFARMGDVAMYLTQAASSPRLLRTGTDGARAYRFPPLAIPPGSQLAGLVERYGDHEVPPKLEIAARIVADNARAGRKTLLWSNFPANLLDLELQLAELQPALVYGGVPSDLDAVPGVRTREREIRRFKEDDGCMVLLANPAAMSEGVSLHRACHDAVYVDRTFNAGQYLQSLDRIHRLGLDEGTETRVTVLTSTGTIDDRIAARLQLKVDQLSRLLDDGPLTSLAFPSDDDIVDFVDDGQDIYEILRHLRGSGDPTDDVGG